MRFTAKWIWAAASAAAIAASPGAQAAGEGHSSGMHSSGGHWGGGSHGAVMHGSTHSDGHWNGGHDYGGGRYYGGWRGGYRGGWHSSVGFYFGVPLFWGSWWDPFYYPGAYYPGERVVYREVIRDPEAGEATRQLLPSQGGPGEGGVSAPPSNPMSTNYCPSAKAYFPQVRNCPEGWQLTSPTS